MERWARVSDPWLQFTLKVASRCNLACSYCYVYEKGDETWRDQPGLMSEEIFLATLGRIREHCDLVGQTEVDVVFHGGEPTLLGRDRFFRWCDTLRAELGSVGRVRITVQTNGTFVDRRWAEGFKEHDVTVGVSLDGPAPVNDALRIDHQGRGSHDRVIAGIAAIRTAGVPVNILTVVQLGREPLEVHEHLVAVGASSISYLFPDETHDSIATTRSVFGPTPCADFLLPILESWWSEQSSSLVVQPFKLMARAVLGGATAVDFIGNNAYNYVFVEPDGAIEGLDVLRVCQPGLAGTGLNVRDNRFLDIGDRSPLHREMLFDGMPLPGECAACPERVTCGGGYVPHRWGGGTFDHRSAWCADLLAIFTRVRELLDVTPSETLLRRQVLAELQAEALQDWNNAHVPG